MRGGSECAASCCSGPDDCDGPSSDAAPLHAAGPLHALLKAPPGCNRCDARPMAPLRCTNGAPAADTEVHGGGLDLPPAAAPDVLATGRCNMVLERCQITIALLLSAAALAAFPMGAPRWPGAAPMEQKSTDGRSRPAPGYCKRAIESFWRLRQYFHTPHSFVTCTNKRQERGAARSVARGHVVDVEQSCRSPWGLLGMSAKCWRHRARRASSRSSSQ